MTIVYENNALIRVSNTNGGIKLLDTKNQKLSTEQITNYDILVKNEHKLRKSDVNRNNKLISILKSVTPDHARDNLII